MTDSAEQSARRTEHAVIGRFIRGSGAAFLGKMVTYPLGLLLTMLFTRLMSTGDVGGYFLVISLVMLGSGLAQAGLAATMCKLVARFMAADNPRGVRKTIRIGVVALACTAVLVFAIFHAETGRWILSQLQGGEALLDTVSWIAAMIVAFAAVNYCTEILRGFSDLPAAALFDQQLMQRLLIAATLITAVVLRRTLTLVDVLMITASAAALSAVLGAMLISRKWRRLGSHGPSVGTGTVLREAPAFLLIRINNWTLNSAAVWVLGLARPLEEAALFGAANVVALLALGGWQVVSAAISPTVITLHAAEKRLALESVIRSAAAVAALPGILLTTLLIFYGSEVLSLLFTDAYSAGASVMVILVVGRTISTLFGSPMMMLSMTQHQDIVLKVLVITSIVTLIVYFLVSARFGAVGIAIASGASAVFQGLVFAVICRRTLSVNTLPSFSLGKIQELLSLATHR